MRVLSAKLDMQNCFNPEDFYSIITKWLKNAGPCKTIGEELEQSSYKADFQSQTEYCKANNYVFKKPNIMYTVFKLEQIFHEQTWYTEVILQETNDLKTVYFHVSCSRDLTRFDDVPEIRTAVIRFFVESDFIKHSEIPVKTSPVEMTDGIIGWIANAYQEKYADDIPLVLATTYFNSMACEIDENTVARKLAGIAHVIVCNNEYTRLIKDRAQCKGPFNGAVAIYCKGGKPKQFRKDSVYHGTSLETMIIQEVQKYITAKVDETAPTYESLHTEEVKEHAKQNEAMLNEFFDENETLEDRLKKAKDRIAELSSENLQLKMKHENLQKKMECNNALIPLLKKANISEFYEGEQHDLVVTILQKALCTSGTEETRRHELLSALLKENAIIGNGEETFEVIKKFFSDGEEMSPQDIAELKRIGFEVVSEKNHYKLVYKNSKYWFTASKTPSDKRGGKNLASDITRRLSVYK